MSNEGLAGSPLILRVVVLAVLVTACSRRPANEQRSVPAGESTPSSCAEGFVEIDVAGRHVRYTAGREWSAGAGATHAFAERITSNAADDFHLDVFAYASANDEEGGIKIALEGFAEPTRTPAVYESARIYLSPHRDEDEGALLGPRVVLTRFGPPGTFVDGTFGARALRGRFHVCRAPDRFIEL